MSLISILNKNKEYSNRVQKEEKNFFKAKATTQNPKYLWLGCCDSRVPETTITNAKPGDIFVHRNIGNQVQSNDINCMSAIEFSIKHLKIQNIIICGHSNCGAMYAGIEGINSKYLSTWVNSIRQIYIQNKKNIKDDIFKNRYDQLSIINIKNQILNLKEIIEEQITSTDKINIYGLYYDLQKGLLEKV